MGKPTESHGELLRRASATGLSDREIEKQVPLAQAFLAKARKGGNDSARAEVAWERLASWLDSRQGGEGATQAPAAIAVAAPPVASPAAAPTPATPRAEDEAKRKALVKAMKEAGTLEQLDAVTALVFEGVSDGWIEGSKSTRYLQVIETRRKTLERLLEEKARLEEKGDRTIEVVYVQDWRPTASSSPPTPASSPG